MIGRVTQTGLQRAALENLQGNLTRMSDLQARLSSGKVIRRPSDDPAGTVDAMRIRSDQRATAQHARNAADGVGWLSSIDTALNGSLASLRRARDLTVQGSNTGALGQEARTALATEIRATAEAIREQANTTYLGRPVFAGTSNAGAAFPGEGATGTFTGTDGAVVERRVSATTTVRVDSDGGQVFGTEPLAEDAGPDDVTPQTSVFALLNHIATRLEGNEPVNEYLTDIDDRMGAMLTEVARVGTRYNQVLLAQDNIEARKVNLDSQLSGVEDADLAETIVELQIQEVAYSAALNATSRALQPSLLDFLR